MNRRLLLWLVPPFITFVILAGSLAFSFEQMDLKDPAPRDWGRRVPMPILAASFPALGLLTLYAWRKETINRRFLRLLAETDSVHFGCLFTFVVVGCLGVLAVSAGLIALGVHGRPGEPAPRWIGALLLTGAIVFVVAMFVLGAAIGPKNGSRK